LVRHLLHRQEIAAAQLDAVETELVRGDVDQPLHDEHHFRPPGAAVWPRGCSVGHHATGTEVCGRHPIDAGHDLDALLNHGVVTGPSAEIADVVTAHRQEITLSVEGELRIHCKIAALVVAEQCLTSIRRPSHGTADLARSPGHQKLFRENLAAHAKITADVSDH